ncbi:ER membrane protein [Trichoderma compactum]
MSLDLERHLTFYGAYHHNPVNVAIHMICVPLLLVSGFALATYTGTLIRTPSWLTVPYLDLNLGTIAAFLYASLYLLLEPVAGFVLAAFCLGSTAFVNSWHLRDPTTTFQVALGVHVVSWIAQFIGHGVFEGHAPALLDNLVQAIFLAPMFVWLEMLFKLGYRRELQARVEKSVSKEIAKFQATSKNGKAN